jgi:hypothetical protein
MPTYNGIKQGRIVARNWTKEQYERHKNRAGYAGLTWVAIPDPAEPVGVKKSKPEPAPENKQEGAIEAQP